MTTTAEPIPLSATDEASAWRRHADDLARWAAARLVNRTDVWGAYLPLCFRTADGSKSVTRPRRCWRGQRHLTHDLLVEHFRGGDPADVIGTHSTSPENTSLWGLVDIDAHDGGNIKAVANERVARAWYRRLVNLGFHPLLTTSDERGGFHLRVLFDRPAPTPIVHAFLVDLTADACLLGASDVEIFPKQSRIEPDGFGNWARAPGRHHTREVWSKVWEGKRWLEGEDAVLHLLGLTGDSPTLIPPSVMAPPPRQAAGIVLVNLPELKPSSSTGTDDRRMTDAEVALACLDSIDNSGDGCHYDRWLAVGMVLHDLDASGVMLDRWVAWSRKSSKHKDGVCEHKWSSFGSRSGWTVGSLVAWAREGGTNVFSRSGGRRP